MKKVLIVMCFIVIFLTACKNEEIFENNDNIKKKIIENMDKILEVSDGFSSIPSTYIENEYYTNIVEIGEDAVPVLIDLYKELYFDSLEGYIAALAVQDITGCDLNKKYNLKWSNASEFFELWENNNCSYNN